MSARTADHLRYARKRAAGICVRCGKEPARPGMTEGEICAALRRPVSREYQRRLEGK